MTKVVLISASLYYSMIYVGIMVSGTNIYSQHAMGVLKYKLLKSIVMKHPSGIDTAELKQNVVVVMSIFCVYLLPG